MPSSVQQGEEVSNSNRDANSIFIFGMLRTLTGVLPIQALASFHNLSLLGNTASLIYWADLILFLFPEEI